MIRSMVFGILLAAVSVTPVHADVIAEQLAGGTPQIIQRSRALVWQGVPRHEVISLGRAIVDHGIEPEYARRILGVISEAARGGLPVTPLFSKAHEGIAKKVPGERLIAGLVHTRQRYAAAYSNARGTGATGENLYQLVEIIADALAAGMEPSDVDELVHAIQINTQEIVGSDQLVLHAMEMVRTMSRLGVDKDMVVALAEDALAKGYGGREIQELTETFSSVAEVADPDYMAQEFRTLIRENRRFDRSRFSSMNGAKRMPGSRWGAGDKTVGRDGEQPLRLRDGSGGGSGSGALDGSGDGRQYRGGQ